MAEGREYREVRRGGCRESCTGQTTADGGGSSCEFGISGKCETPDDFKQGNDRSEFFEIPVAALGLMP